MPNSRFRIQDASTKKSLPEKQEITMLGSAMKPEQGALLIKAEDSLNAAKLMQENGYRGRATSPERALIPLHDIIDNRGEELG
jgi:hypothetical protein